MPSKKPAKTNNFFIVAGLVLFLSGLSIFLLTFFPVIKEEAKYSLKPLTAAKKITPVDTDFGIVIPKILANAKVVANVDPYNSKEYQWALTKGVAHAKGTAFPGFGGNSFIFAHSSGNWYDANRYNSVFYLLHKLEKDDEIDVYYANKKYVYKVTAKKFVDPKNVSFLNPASSPDSTLTLMTCWPPGTTLKRLIIQAKISQ